MTYAVVATIRESPSLARRMTAAAATEANAAQVGDSAFAGQWTSERSWDLASTPGWAEAWASADAGGNVDPGADEAVITDGMILARVQNLLALYPMPDAP